MPRLENSLAIVIAMPSKRRNTVINMSKELSNITNSLIIIMSFTKFDTSVYRSECPKSTLILEIPPLIRQNLYNEDSNYENAANRNKGTASRKIHKYISNFIYSKVIPRIGFGTTLLEEILRYKLLYKAELLENMISTVVPSYRTTNLVFLAEGDRNLDLEKPLLMIKMKYSNIKYVICEVADSATEKDLSIYPKEKFSKLFTSKYQKLAQHKFKNTSYKGTYYHPHAHSNVLWEFGVDSTYPWRIGFTKGVDLTLLRNRQSIIEMTEIELDTSNFEVIGDINFDSLLRKKLHQVKTKKKNTSRLAIALPNWLEHDREIRRGNLRKVRPFLYQVFTALANHFDEIVIVLHPKQSRNDYEFLEEIPDVTISDNSIYDEIVKATVFCATNSSTLNLAHVLGIPVIVLLPKFWKLSDIGTKKLSSSQWVKIIKSPSQISRRMISDLQQASSEYFSSIAYLNDNEVLNFNGKGTERLVKDINHLFEY